MNKIGFEIRWMIRADMEHVEHIDELSNVRSWSTEDFIAALRKRNTVGKVYVVDERFVIGFMIYELHQHDYRITKLAIHPDARRVGIGSDMLQELIQRAESAVNRSVIRVNVRETNLNVQLFLRSNGFQCESMDREFYSDTNEDSLFFSYRLHDDQPLKGGPEC